MMHIIKILNKTSGSSASEQQISSQPQDLKISINTPIQILKNLDLSKLNAEQRKKLDESLEELIVDTSAIINKLSHNCENTNENENKDVIYKTQLQVLPGAFLVKKCKELDIDFNDLKISIDSSSVYELNDVKINDITTHFKDENGKQYSLSSSFRKDEIAHVILDLPFDIPVDEESKMISISKEGIGDFKLNIAKREQDIPYTVRPDWNNTLLFYRDKPKIDWPKFKLLKMNKVACLEHKIKIDIASSKNASLNTKSIFKDLLDKDQFYESDGDNVYFIITGKVNYIHYDFLEISKKLNELPPFCTPETPKNCKIM